jgi:Tfp pilus assembly protein PilF
MNASSSLSRSVRLLLIGGFGLIMCVLNAEPFLPKDDAQVLERLRTAPFDSAARELRDLRSRAAAEPNSFELAAELARRCIERSRAEGDPRYLGRAEAALTHWWSVSDPPAEALLLRAIIRQSQHDFTNALIDLDSSIRLAPKCAQAWLTRTTILTVLGRFEEARGSCLQVAQFAPRTVAFTAAAALASVNGGAESSCRLLRQFLKQSPVSRPAEHLWALTVLAETSARLGHNSEADAEFREALGPGRRDAYLLGAYADFLLDCGRNQEVMDLLKDETRVDALLLRLALAESALPKTPASLSGHLSALQARFEASRLRGDQVHRREQARFTLHLLHQPAEALRLARANWDVQREPADARVLLETAVVARDSSAALPVVNFVRKSKLEDVQVTKLISQLPLLAAP